MKLSVLSLVTLGMVAAPTLAQNTTTQPTPTFNWKLRLTKGQTWNQTLTTQINSTQEFPFRQGGKQGKKTKFELETRQKVSFKNEVVAVTPTYYLIRLTYTHFGVSTTARIKGQLQKVPATPQPDFVGLTFSLKEAPDGRILDVIGLEGFVARQNKFFDSAIKSPAEREALRRIAPSRAAIKKSIIDNHTLSLPATPLAVGEGYSYPLSLPGLTAFNINVHGERLLLSFDAQKARFVDAGHFDVAPTQVFGPSEKTVTLTGNAAKYYLMHTHHVSPTATAAYLSKNGRIYYRNAKDPKQVIWLDPPAAGIKIKESEAAPYHQLQGFDGQGGGMNLSDFLDAHDASEDQSQLPKTFITVSGQTRGNMTVDATTGLVLRCEEKVRMQGKESAVGADGSKQTVPIDSSTQITLVTEPNASSPQPVR